MNLVEETLVVNECSHTAAIGDVTGLVWIGEKLLIADSSGTISIDKQRLTLDTACTGLTCTNSTAYVTLVNGQVASIDTLSMKERSRMTAGMPGIALNAICSTVDSLLVVATELGEVALIDTRSNCIAYVAPPANPSSKFVPINCVDAKDNFVVSGDDSGRICLWDIRQTQSRLYSSLHESAVLSVKLHPNSHEYILSSALDGSLLMHSVHEDCKSWQMPASRFTPSLPISCIDMVGGLAAAGMDAGGLLFWRMDLSIKTD